ncbi:MAG: hypothetical protein Q7U73_19360 [Rubrivivax sp.]|nr:hypothetical protein [Rubrivivax sp.]
MTADTNPPAARLPEAEGVVGRFDGHQVPRGAGVHAREGERLPAFLRITLK